MRIRIRQIISKARREQGITIIMVALLLVVLAAFTALAVDIAHLLVVRNELQNAADAGALAGARCLYSCYSDPAIEQGAIVNVMANQIAFDAATANKSEKIPVEVNWVSGNTGDVERGHWSFATRTFTPSNNETPPVLWNVSDAELDNDVTNVNAVRVRTRREDSQASSFFAGILGMFGFNLNAEAIAYIGFAGKLQPMEVDQPIGICKQAVEDQLGNYTCNTGRMLNSGANNATRNTAGWTNFSQPCETANANEMKSLICSQGNPYTISFGEGIGATGGVQNVTLAALRDCFGPTTRTEPWNMTLPVIDCPGNNVSNCATVVGAVNIDIVWISDKDDLEKDDFPPASMGDWSCPAATCGSDRECCWNDFVTHFNLKNVDDLTATYAKKSIYFLPDCTPHEPTGSSGGQNFGIQAKTPVLVN